MCCQVRRLANVGDASGGISVGGDLHVADSDVWSVMHKLPETEGLVPITAKQIDAIPSVDT